MPCNCEHQVVGNESCSYRDVCDVLHASKSNALLWSKLNDLGKCLDISGDFLMIIISSSETPYSKLYNLLQAWRGMKSYHATLQILVVTLERQGLKDCADDLKKQFCTDYPSVHSETSVPTVVNEQPLEMPNEETFEPCSVIQDTPTAGPAVNTQVTRKFAKLCRKTLCCRTESPRRKQLKRIVVLSLPLLFTCVFVLGIVLGMVNCDPDSYTPLGNGTDRIIFVASSLEFTSKMRHIASNDRVSLHLAITDPIDWKPKFKLPYAETISEITFDGPFFINSIYEILNQLASYLKRLTILDTRRVGLPSTCSYDSNEDIPLLDDDKLIILPLLEKFHLNVPQCDRIYHLLYNYFYLPKIVEMKFDLNEQWFEQSLSFKLVEKIFYNSTNSMTSIGIHKISSHKVFNNLTAALPRQPHVSKLTLHKDEIIDSTDSAEYDFVHLLETVFPSVEVLNIDGFVLPHGFLTLSHLSPILVKLKVAIQLEDMSFDLNSIPPRLSNLDLFLAFSSCNKSTESPKVIDSRSQSKRHAQIKITSNCKFSTPGLLVSSFYL